MKSGSFFLAIVLVGALGGIWACKKEGPAYPMDGGYGGGGGGGGGPTPTAMPGGHNVACSGTHFNPDSLTINAGESVTWTSSCSPGHTLYINSGTGGSSCPVQTSSFPYTRVFSTPGTYLFHCSVHSPCGTTSCSGCTGMAGTLTVN